MEETREDKGQEQITGLEATVVHIRNQQVMQTAVDVLSLLGKNKQITLKAKGNSIPSAVAVANIITEKMMKGNSKIYNIKLDTDAAPGIGKMLSTIEIVLIRI